MLFTSEEAKDKIDKRAEKAQEKQSYARRKNSVFVSGSKVSAGQQRAESFDRIRGVNPSINANNNLSRFLPTTHE